MPALREWQLFIDETGNADNPAESLSVIGWLVQHRQNQDFDRTLRSALGFVFPDAAWPPHASVQNLPISQAVVFRVFGHANREDRCWINEAPDVWRDLSAVDDDAVQKVVALANNRRFADYEVLKKANAALPGAAPRLFRRLQAQREARARRMAGLLERVRDCFGPGESWLVGASGSPDDQPPHGDRYLALLEALFVRVFALLRSDDNAVDEVRAFVAGRDIYCDVIRQRIRLRVKDIGDCVRKAESFPLRAPQLGGPDPRVRIVPHEVAEYNNLVRPGIVLADFAANRLRWPLATAPTWPNLREQSEVRVVLPVDAPPRMEPTVTLPTMAAHGMSANVIFDAFSRGGAVDVPRMNPGWTVDQAKQWVDVAARWT